MARRRFSPLDRVLGRIDDLDAQNLAILARRLERERDLMETVLDTLREGVIVLSHDGAIEYANASAPWKPPRLETGRRFGCLTPIPLS